MGEPPGGGTSEQVDIYLKFQQAAFKFIDGDAVKPLRVVVDGGNGMAGPMIGPLLQPPEARPRSRPTGSPTASSPATSPTRCCPRTASSSWAR